MALLSDAASSFGANRPFIDEAEPHVPSSVEERDRTWKEGATSLPPWPADSNLVEFHVDDPDSQFRQYIDRKSIRIGTDEVVRYTLVVEAPSGTRNVSYEGLRCTPNGAVKVYAYGNSNRFEKITGEWMVIQGRAGDAIHRELHKQLLCVPRKFEPRPVKDAVRALQTRFPHEGNRGFLPD
jgi:hypothetical protein